VNSFPLLLYSRPPIHGALIVATILSDMQVFCIYISSNMSMVEVSLLNLLYILTIVYLMQESLLELDRWIEKMADHIINMHHQLYDALKARGEIMYKLLSLYAPLWTFVLYLVYSHHILHFWLIYLWIIIHQ